MKTFALAWPLLMMLTASSISAAAEGGPAVVALPGQSPLVTFRMVFRTGAAYDPADKPGVAALTAAMLSQGGTKTKTYQQIIDALFPMAVSISSEVDKEMITFGATTHVDNLESFYALFRSMLLEPGWRAEDLTRLREDAINYLRVSLRGNNDEELGKEVLYQEIYAGHPYGVVNPGSVSALKAMTIDDLKAFYRDHLTQANLVIGLAGGYPPAFLERVKKDFVALPAGKAETHAFPEPKPIGETRLTMVEKQTRAVAYSLGYPIEVRRGHPDYPALLLAQSYFGQHRMSGGRLYERLRQIRGLNYGDYAYIEYFPAGMFRMEPAPNLARSQQIFQIWIRPVEPETAHFALRLALFELDRLVQDGLTQEEFERTRSFLTKNVNLLTRTKDAELGYAIDSVVYGIPNYHQYVKDGLAKLTRDQVNQAIRRHLRPSRLQIVAVTDHAADLQKRLLADESSPMKYNSPKPDDVLKEDALVEGRKLGLKPANVKVVPADRLFE